MYQKKLGTAMDSPVSPIVANLFMEDLEQRAIESAPNDLRPKLWKRYVDDTLEVIRRGKVAEWSLKSHGPLEVSSSPMRKQQTTSLPC